MAQINMFLSTILASFLAAEKLFAAEARRSGIEVAQPCVNRSEVEFTVDPPQGRGKASHTDIMIRSGPHALAIEAKWSEALYSILFG